MPTSSIWIPCEAFDVVVTADDDAPTDLEKAVMLFLYARRDHSIEDVVAFLGLSERLTMDLLIGLWRQGYIIVDVVDGGVRLDPAWEKRVQAGHWNGMKSAHRVSDTVELMRELVSGQLVADRSTPAAPPPDRAVPVLVSSSLYEALTRTELAAAAIRSLGRGSRLASRIRKVRAEVARARLRDAPRPLSWIQLEVEAQVDSEDEHSITLRPIPSEDVVIARVAPGITRALNDWALGNADHPVVRGLMGSASKASVQPQLSLAARLNTLVRDLEAALRGPARMDGGSEPLAQSLAALAGEIDDVEAARARATLIPLPPDPRAYMRHLTAFEHQLVLISPELDDEGLEACAEGLVHCLKERPVDASAVLLWGGRGRPSLPGRAASFLANMAAETAGPSGPRLRWSQRGTRISTTVAVLDGCEVLYSNVAPFAASGRQGFGFLLRIQAGAGSSLPRRLLEIARERAPDTELAEIIQLRAWSSTDGPRGSEAAEGETGGWGRELSEPRLAPPGDLLAQRIRLHDHLEGARAEQRRLEAAGASADALVDAALFRTALEIVADANPGSREATLWLGFGPDHHSGRPVPVHRRVVEAVAARAAEGLTTIILTEDSPDSTMVDLGSLKALANIHPQLVRMVPVPGLAGHFVCGERRFVTAPGGLASPPTPEVKRLSNRLVGIAASDPELCHTFREACAAQWPVLAACTATQGHEPDRSADGAAAQAAPLVPIYAAWAEAGAARRQVLAAALRRVDGFEGPTVAALEKLTEGIEDAVGHALRRDMLSVVAAHGEGLQRQRALHELAAEAWSTGDWQAAALLLGSCKPPTPVPEDLAGTMVEVAAGLPLEALPMAFQAADPEEWMASVALATWAVLFNGDATAAEMLEIKLSLGGAPAEAEPLVRTAEAVLAHWAASGAQVDLRAFRALYSRAAAQAALGERAVALCDAFRLGLNANYNNAMLKRVVPRFYTTTSGIRPIVDLLSTDGAAPDWKGVLTSLDRTLGEADPNDLADERLEAAHHAYADAKDDRIQGRKGAAIRLGTRELMRRARELQEAIRTSQEAAAGVSSDALSSLFAALRQTSPRLIAMADAAQAGTAKPVIAALARRIAQLVDGTT